MVQLPNPLVTHLVCRVVHRGREHWKKFIFLIGAQLFGNRIRTIIPSDFLRVILLFVMDHESFLKHVLGVRCHLILYSTDDSL